MLTIDIREDARHPRWQAAAAAFYGIAEIVSDPELYIGPEGNISNLVMQPARLDPRALQTFADAIALGEVVQPVGVKVGDGAVPVLRLSRRSFPIIAKAFADAGYAGDKPAIIAVEIVRKPKDQVGFAVYPRRWVVV